MHSGLQVDDRRPLRIREAARADENGPGDRRGRDARAAELAALVAVAEAQKRIARVPEHLCEEPRAAEERDGGPERRVDPGEPDDPHQQRELEQAERDGEPAGLVVEQPVVDLDVEREADAGHQRGQDDWPPSVQPGGEDHRGEQHRKQRREPRVDASPQGVGHA